MTSPLLRCSALRSRNLLLTDGVKLTSRALFYNRWGAVASVTLRSLESKGLTAAVSQIMLQPVTTSLLDSHT